MRRKPEFDGTFDRKGNRFTDAYGVTVDQVHSERDCADRSACAIHRPSDHSMRRFPIKLRIPSSYDIKPLHLERICPHGIGHPDPDDLLYHGQDIAVHGCDGCCRVH